MIYRDNIYLGRTLIYLEGESVNRNDLHLSHVCVITNHNGDMEVIKNRPGATIGWIRAVVEAIVIDAANTIKTKKKRAKKINNFKKK